MINPTPHIDKPAYSYSRSPKPGAMNVADLPVDILTNVFQNLDLMELAFIQTFFNKSLQSSPVYRVIETVRYSRIVVTIKWHGLIQLLARACRISSLEMLSKFQFVDLVDFLPLIPQLQQRWHPEVPIRRQIAYVFGCDQSNYHDRYRVMRMFTRLLRSMPAHVQNASRQVYLYFHKLNQFGDSDIDGEAVAAMFGQIASSPALWSSVEKLTMQGTMAAHEAELDLTRIAWNFGNFERLASICLSNMGFVTLRNLILPESLKELNLSQNSIIGVNEYHFPEGLESLDLSYNNLSGTINCSLPVSLKSLNLRRNFISKIKRLPDSLEILDVSFNELPCTMFPVSRALQILKTDIAQYYLMTEDMQRSLRERNIVIRKHIASHTTDSIFTFA